MIFKDSDLVRPLLKVLRLSVVSLQWVILSSAKDMDYFIAYLCVRILRIFDEFLEGKIRFLARILTSDSASSDSLHNWCLVISKKQVFFDFCNILQIDLVLKIRANFVNLELKMGKI